MYHYNLQEWLLFFFIYCFLGWCWESCYVSAKKHQWVNRGFMKGPFLPIYGFGALSVLIATLPVRPFPVLVFVFGMLGATALELVTGICMEKLFHVRYWDYSNQKFNYKGHICLTSSIAWGAFSLAMIYGFHKPIEKLVLSIPFVWLDILTTVLTVIVAADFAISFKTAMELRAILDNMERIKDEMKRLQKRAEVIEAFLADDFHDAKENFKEEMQERKDNLIEGLQERKEDAKAQLQEIRDKQKYYLEKKKYSMSDNSAIANLLRRNPSAVSGRHALAFKEYRDKLIENIKREVGELTKSEEDAESAENKWPDKK
ncbi:MAG: hypothetical protein PUE95_03005 [Lachnospiraceae bacterium]|nr:hypothetical protein [Lachnospiraceae bacterium]